MCLRSANKTSVVISAHVYSNTHSTHSKKYQKLLVFFCLSFLAFIGLLLTQTACDMESNSSDSTDTLFPCGNCKSPVTYDHKGLHCETCNMWYHAPCQRVGDLQYDYLSNSSCSWHCTKCDSANYSTSITQDLNSFTTTNRFSTLDTSQDCIFTPTQTSTPAKEKHVKDSSKTTSSVKIALINFQSIREKKSQFYTFVSTNKPDIIVGTETWLTAENHDNEYFPLN